MRPSKLLTFLMAIVLVACQSHPVVVTPAQTSLPTPIPQASPSATLTAMATAPAPFPTATSTAAASAGETPEGETPAGHGVDFSTSKPFAQIELKTFQPSVYPDEKNPLPVNLSALGNPVVIQGLTQAQKDFLSKNGFVVTQAGDQQFKTLRRTVSTHYGQPYYLTTDAAYHALHKTFDDLLASFEQEYLRPVLGRLLQAEYDKVKEYVASTQGQPLGKDADLAQNYLAVAIKLLYPEKTFESQVETKIAPQIAQIMAYGGKQNSALIQGLQDDYGAYRPVSHYAGVPALENYFRAMSWLGRVPFKFKDPDVPGLVPSRAPLLMTLALREAQVDSKPAYQVWSEMYAITNFMVGPSDDPGPVELNQLMEQVYGPAPTLSGLADEGKWQGFLAKVDQLPAPQIDSTFASFSVTQAASRDWRFMGQRFTLDGFIFQNLIYDKVGTQQKPRGFPSGLDVAAAFGSQPALQVLEAAGATQYAHYSEQMSAVQKIVNDQPENEWLNRFYSAWLYAFRPQVVAKEQGFPPFMRTSAWGYKEVNSLLGSWAELKHDTVLYAKMPEAKGGGGPPTSGPAPAYAEPNPNVFYRLAYATAALHEGLAPYVNDWEMMGWQEQPPDTGYPPSISFNNHFQQLGSLAESFQKFGDIAARELKGEVLTADDYDVLQGCLELKDCMDHGLYSGNPPEMEPIPVVAAVSGYQDSILEAGVGQLNRIYVAVPLEGSIEIAQGGVFSYYEFTQPRTDRLTDQAWREKLQKDPPPAPAWMSQFVLPGGTPTNALAFRIGDVYVLTEKGYNPPLNLRAGPSKSDAVVLKLDQENYFTIKDGPVKNKDGTWWKVELFFYADNTSPTGWLLENPDWYQRSTTE
jgi:hypothetical protein